MFTADQLAGLAARDPRLARLIRRRDDAIAARKDIVGDAEARGAEDLSDAEDTEFRSLSDQITALDERIEELAAEARRGDSLTEAGRVVRDHAGLGAGWAARAATALRSMGGEQRAVVSGSVDIPSLVATDVVTKPHAERLIDLVVNRQSLTGNAFEFYRQTVRTNLAAPVADGTLKPTSTFTFEPVTDRARVVAHLSEAVPLRLLDDHAEVERWLRSELQEGVLSAIESQMISGAGTGETFTGILATTGITTQAYATDPITTLRKARTAMEIKNEKPTAWVLHPTDAEAIDLAREEEDGAFLATGGYSPDSTGPSNNVFGTIPRLLSTSVPVGTALLADWNQIRLYVREGVRIDVDTAGADLFDKNLAKFRAETRIGIGVLRPQAFAKITLSA
ncbi:phage major capsid protein [Gordonia sp. NB41Y]|uniref:phage major capsid protein n=1 Tax=Gordonia sp. NB41Y TaxID=875808 RepID=UPI00034787A4|nr:phage major capsid protein [Gordonia sp. NB41Y]WLP91445.1 phage major capsid protein [Gordonia sp. NB41Y]